MNLSKNLYETIMVDDDITQEQERNRRAAIPKPTRLLALGETLKRSNSMGDGRKRKARDSTSGTEGNILKKKEDPISYILIETLAEICRQIKDLGKKTEENVNTKREIKEISQKLGRQAEVIGRLSVKQWLEDHRWVKVKAPTYEVETQTDPRGRDMATQVKQETRDVILSLEGVDTVEDFKAIKDKRWDRETFKVTEMKEGGGLLSTKDNVVKIIWVDPEDASMGKGEAERIKNRYPFLGESKTDLEVFEQTTRTMSENTSKNEKIIKVTAKADEEAMWGHLARLREATKDDEWVAISFKLIRRMAECIFRDGGTKIIVYPAKGKAPGHLVERRQNTRERKTYALVVEEPGKDYKEVLGKVKAAARNSTASSAIRGLRSTKDGKRLVIITDKDEEAVSRLQITIGESEGLNIIKKTTATKTETVHIRGIDALTTKEETVGRKLNVCRLSELRPLANNTLAATLTTDRDAVEALASKGAIRIGMVRCLIERRIKIPRCTRCWSHEHEAKECDGPDRSKLCFMCGGEGHTVKDCGKEEACPLCETAGHSANRGRCKLFRRALSKARNETKGRSNSTITAVSQALEAGTKAAEAQALEPGTKAVETQALGPGRSEGVDKVT